MRIRHEHCYASVTSSLEPLPWEFMTYGVNFKAFPTIEHYKLFANSPITVRSASRSVQAPSNLVSPYVPTSISITRTSGSSSLLASPILISTNTFDCILLCIFVKMSWNTLASFSPLPSSASPSWKHKSAKTQCALLALLSFFFFWYSNLLVAAQAILKRHGRSHAMWFRPLELKQLLIDNEESFLEDR